MQQMSPYAKYQEQNTLTASPGELTLMLYDGCIKALRRGALFIGQQKMEDAHNELIRVQNILAELQSTLDMQYEVSEGLFALYDYMRMAAAGVNTTKNADAIPEIIGLLAEIRDAWQEAIRANRRSSMADLTEQEAQ